ncbi:MAG TPA: biopolymer transporter ExbD [Gemmatimonadaceae bacterium]|nr:biopolymer transporter ExbD [Gemmatimonadaceae bacterium]
MRRRRERLPLNADINVVPLIDVMILMLVIFMITAPLMQGGVEVELPVAEARPLEARSSLVVTVDRNGTVYVDDTPMTFGEFRAAFRALAEGRARQGAYLRGDSRVELGYVLRVLAVMRNAGVSNVGFIVEPEAEK